MYAVSRRARCRHRSASRCATPASFSGTRSVPVARRTASFAKWEAEFIDSGRLGKLRFIVDFERGKLLLHEKNYSEARRRLQSALDCTDEYGPSEGRRQVAELLAGLGERGA